MRDTIYKPKIKLIITSLITRFLPIIGYGLAN